MFRSGKNTHISTIRNSVIRLRSYTNTAIADIVGNSDDITTPSDDVSAPSADVSAPSTDVSAPTTDVSASSADIIASNGDCLSVTWCFAMKSVSWWFTSGYGGLCVVHDVLRVFHDVSQCFSIVSWCFTTFSKSRNDRHRRPPIASGIASMLLKSAIMRQGSQITPQGSTISPRKWSHAKLCPEWRLE